MRQKHGYFCVSLDFEMFWGMQDATTIAAYGAHILGGKRMIPAQLALFSEYGIHATWGIVGFLLAHDKEELLRYSPAKRPTYTLARRDPYRRFDELGEDEAASPYYFARAMADEIMRTPHQTLGSHTFSHYYCDEKGQTPEQFIADLRAAVRIATDSAYPPRSLILPRNQCEDIYLQACAALGFVCFRGKEDNWIYRRMKKESLLRAMRYLDSYFPMSGSNAHPLTQRCGMTEVTGSAFLRPYEPKLKLLEPLKIQRIKGQMRYAAKHGLVYHLYWHPHNLGVHAEKTMSAQRKLFAYYQKLHDRYGFESKNMEELAALRG